MYHFRDFQYSSRLLGRIEHQRCRIGGQGRQISNPIPARWADYAHHITTGPPRSLKGAVSLSMSKALHNGEKSKEFPVDKRGGLMSQCTDFLPKAESFLYRGLSLWKDLRLNISRNNIWTEFFSIFIPLVAHRFGYVEFWIFVVVFYRQAQLKKIKTNI